jgi:phosphotransferase system  glucose/maltose/N-acetylglucosamine-specific IIC component
MRRHTDVSTMDRKTGIIVTVVLAVLFGCAGIFTCVGGIFSLGSALEQVGYELLRVWQWLGVLEGICTTLAFVAVPVVFYFLLVHGRKEADGEEEVSEEEEEASDASEE